MGIWGCYIESYGGWFYQRNSPDGYQFDIKVMPVISASFIWCEMNAS